VKAYDERALLMEMPYELRHGILEHTYRDIIVKVRFHAAPISPAAITPLQLMTHELIGLLMRLTTFPRRPSATLQVPLFDVNGDGKVDDHVFVTELCSRMHKVTFAKGSLIFQRGEIATHMFIIWTGAVEVMDGKVCRLFHRLAPSSAVVPSHAVAADPTTVVRVRSYQDETAAKHDHLTAAAGSRTRACGGSWSA
jgi:hypothetical protein